MALIDGQDVQGGQGFTLVPLGHPGAAFEAAVVFKFVGLSRLPSVCSPAIFPCPGCLVGPGRSPETTDAARAEGAAAIGKGTLKSTFAALLLRKRVVARKLLNPIISLHNT